MRPTIGKRPGIGFSLALLAGALLAGVAVGCDAGGARSTSHAPSSAARAREYVNDGDSESVNDGDMDNKTATHEDGDADSFEEYEDTLDGNRYHDSDDGEAVAWGSAASAAERRDITALVKRYYAVAVAEDGAAACAMMPPSFASSIPEDYGHGSVGPAYLSGARTCGSVMTLLFRHRHEHLTTAVTVTGVRVRGAQAHALLGSRTMPADFITLSGEAGSWRINTPLPESLP